MVVSIYAKKFGIGQWSFIGPGSEKKWYCISEDSPQGVWDNIAERMLVEFAESGCPIFRAASPLSRGQLKKQRTWKTVDTLCSRFGNGWDYYSHNCLCKPAQSLRSSRRDVWRVWNGETRCDGTIKFLTRAWCDRDRSSFWIVMTQRIKIFYFNNMKNELRSCHNKTHWVNFVWMQDFWMLLKSVSISWRKTL